MSDLIRKQFEAAVIERMKESGYLEVEIRVECLQRHGDGYQDGSIDAYWHFWQASRKSVVIEFPPRTPYVEYFDDVEGGCFDYPRYLDDVKTGIRAQGLQCEVEVMNRADARKIADTVTREQLASMLDRAKTGVSDWAAVSSVNRHFTKGKSWNIFYPAFMSGRHLVKPAITNMVHEFGDFLDDDIKPEKVRRQLPDIVPTHEEPRFEVSP